MPGIAPWHGTGRGIIPARIFRGSFTRGLNYFQQ